MGVNKNALLRYKTLDKCFSNFGRKYFMEELIQACNAALYDFSGVENGVKRRQIFDDIKFMESDQGWSISLDRIKDGKKVYYRYSEKTFSINAKGLNSTEAEQLKDTLLILSRFNGMPQFEWVEEIQIRLANSFGLTGMGKASVGFEQNPFLKGLNYFSTLFNAIQNQQPLLIQYQGYKQSNPVEMEIHPWYLKQFNNRWFLFGLNEQNKYLSNLALDRIHALKESPIAYIANTEIDFEEHFEDIIGVTVKPDQPIEKIQLQVAKAVWPYIESKPIHGSQRTIEKTENYVRISLEVQINHELIALLFSYLDGIEIIAPASFKEQYKQIVSSIYLKYF